MIDHARPKMFWDLWSLVTGQGFSTILGFVGFAYLARVLSPDAYGAVEYAVGLAGLGAMVIEGGMGPIGALDVSRTPRRAPELAGQISLARLLLTLIVVPAVGLTAHVSDLDSRATTLLWLYACSLFAVPFKQDWLLQGLDKMTLVAPAVSVKSATFVLAVMLLVHSSGDLVLAGVAEIVAALAGATYYVYILRQLSIAAQLKVRFSQIVARVSSGASVGLTNVVWAFMMYVPISLATNLSTGSEAAWIAGAQRIVVALVSFSALYFFNLYPLMVRGLSDDRARWSRLMGSSFRLIAWSSLGLALCGTLAAEAIVVAAFGAPFAVAAPVFSIYIWLLPLRLLSGHARWTLIAAERQRVLLIVELLTTAMLVALGTVLVPTYGAIGAAVSVIGANVGGWIAAHVAVQRYVGPLPAFGPVALPGVAAVLGGGLAYFLKDYTIIGPALAVGLYVVCMAKSAPGLFADAVRLAHAKTPPA